MSEKVKEDQNHLEKQKLIGKALFTRERGKEEEMTKKLLLISGWDEWYGPMYICPSCGEEKLMDDFNFCPFCGADTKGLKFESIENQQKRIEERKWMKK